MYYVFRERPDTGFDYGKMNSAGRGRLAAGLFAAALGTHLTEVLGVVALPSYIAFALYMLEGGLSVYFGASRLGRRHLSNTVKREGQFYDGLKKK
jgi:hypothetical protein